jgi:hypothetical protein
MGNLRPERRGSDNSIAATDQSDPLAVQIEYAPLLVLVSTVWPSTSMEQETSPGARRAARRCTGMPQTQR